MWRPDRRIRSKKAGLTLIEILVVSVIFSIIVFALFTVFKGGLDSWHKAETLLDIYNSARVTLDMMEREVSSAFLYQESNSTNYWTKFLGTTSGGQIKTNSIADEIFFVAPVEDNPGKQDLCEVGYWLRNDKCLMRHYEYFDGSVMPVAYDFTARADGSADTGALDSIVARNVADFQVTYYYRHLGAPVPATDTPALHSWSSVLNNPGARPENYDSGENAKNPDGLPDAVAVSITVQSKDGLQSKTFTDFIRIVGAK